VRGGSRLIYFPGPLLPQRGSRSSHSLAIDVDATSTVLAASIVLPGRSAMGEHGAFDELRLRTSLRLSGRLVFGEDALVQPCRAPLDGPAVFAGAAASLSIIAAGHWPPATSFWWEQLEAKQGVVMAAGEIVPGAAIVRALAATLGDAQRFLAAIERALPHREITGWPLTQWFSC
jgi:urease accessory protein UreH